MGGAQQGALLREPVLVLLEQPGEPEGEADLGRNAFEQREVALPPDPGRWPVHADKARRPLEHQNRGRNHSHPVRRLYDGQLLLGGAFEELELRRLLSEGLEPRLVPLGTDVRLIRKLPDPDEAA